MSERRKHQLLVRMNDEEKALLEKKYKLSRAKSKSTFVRRIILDGVVIRLEEEKLTNIYRAITSAASNINQIAVRVNSTGNLYKEDIEEIRNAIADIMKQQGYFHSVLLKLKW